MSTPRAVRITGVLEGDVVAVVGAAQFVGHHSQSHDLLPDEGVWPGDVNLHLWITLLIGQAISDNLWEVPAQDRKRLLFNRCGFVLEPQSTRQANAHNRKQSGT